MEIGHLRENNLEDITMQSIPLLSQRLHTGSGPQRASELEVNKRDHPTGGLSTGTCLKRLARYSSGRNGCWRRGNSGRSGCRVPPFSNSFFASHLRQPDFPIPRRHSPFPRRGAVPDSTNLISLYYAVCQARPPVPLISSHRVQLELRIPNTVLRTPNGTPLRPRRPGMDGPVPPQCHCHSDRWWYVVLSAVSSRPERQSLVTQTRTTGRAPGFAISVNWVMANFSTEDPDVPTTYRGRIPDFPSPGGCAP